jgi:hypothetical protein
MTRACGLELVAIDCGHISRLDDVAGVLDVVRSKTDQKARRGSLALARDHAPHCPVARGRGDRVRPAVPPDRHDPHPRTRSGSTPRASTASPGTPASILSGLKARLPARQASPIASANTR